MILFLFVQFFFFSILHSGQLLEIDVPIVHSNALPSPGATTDVRFTTVYLPPEALDPNSTKRFPTVYFFPGFGGNDLTFAETTKLLMDDLLAKGEITPFIVVHVDPSLENGVGPEGKLYYLGTWFVNSELNGDFEEFIFVDLIPFIDQHFPTITDRAYRAVMGQSMGGFGASLLGMTHPESFIAHASASGTPFWSIITNVVPNVVDPGSIQPPGDVMFVTNSLMIPEIPTIGENAGQINPDNGFFTFSFFSYSAAFSPDANNPNPPADAPPFFVRFPVLLDEQFKPIFATGEFTIANAVTGERSTITNSFIPRDDIIDLWKRDNPFILAPNFVSTLQKQAIYLDGGNTELINAVGARQLADKFVSVDVGSFEHLLYNGGHITCLVEPECSRFITIFKMFSAKFAEGGRFADDIRVHLFGNGRIELHDGTEFVIDQQTMVGIETSPQFDVVHTKIDLVIFEGAQLRIGSDTEQFSQGVLQIGDRFTKAALLANEALRENTVESEILLRGGSVLIGEGGFLGFGVGVDGFAPNDSNFWSVSTLKSLKNIAFTILEGTFNHSISSTHEQGKSLFAVGPSTLFQFYINSRSSELLGGGALISVFDGLLVQPVTPFIVGTVLPGGIRSNLDRDPFATDYFYQKPMGSVTFYENKYQYGLLASVGQLADRGEINPFALVTDSLEQFYNRLSRGPEEEYTATVFHTGTLDIAADGTLTLSIIAPNGTVERFSEAEIPIGQDQTIDLRVIAENEGFLYVVASVNENGTVNLIRVSAPITI